MGERKTEGARSPRRWPRLDERDGDDVFVDLRSRLDPLTPAVDRCLTPEELRRRFGPKAKAQEPSPPGQDLRADEQRFTDRFPTESLFVQTPFVTQPKPLAENRSRTAGDYYYDPVDAWDVLGLPPGSAWGDVVKAHRDLAMVHHPDRHLDGNDHDRRTAEETMSRINVAYSVLRRMTGH